MPRTKTKRLRRLAIGIIMLNCMLVSIVSSAQSSLYANNNLSQKNAPAKADSKQLRSALDELEKKYQIKFAINDRLVEHKFLQINNNVKYESLESELQGILKPMRLGYKIVDGYYVIQPSAESENANNNEGPVAGNKPAAGQGEMLSKQQVQITGRVTTERENFPLPGVIIRVSGNPELSTATDVNGNFTIGASRDATLIFSYLGYLTQEVPIAGRGTVNVKLSDDVQNLKEVVITVPYGQQTRSSYTGSATTVRSEKVSDRTRPSFQESLQGNVAGLQVSQGSGQPGAAAAVRIRGTGSFSASNDPLYVVDGIPFTDVPVTGYAWSSNNLAGVNPNDIESITVLKDASATSIYGSRAANGVILITTKKGAAGRTKIDFSVQQGVNSMTMTDRNNPLNTSETMELLVEGVQNNPVFNISNEEDAYQFLIDQGVNPEVDTDWKKLITRTGKFSQYNISSSGGSEKTTFNISAGYYNQDAVIRGVDYERMNSRLNLTHRANDRLNFSGNLSANYQDLNTFNASWWGENPIRNLRLTVPWVSPYNSDGSYNRAVTWNNEILLNENKRNSKIYNLLGNASAEFKIIDPLTVESRVGVDFNFSDEELYWDPEWIDAQSLNGVGGNYVNRILNWNVTNLLKYRQQISDFGVDVTLGHEANKINRKLLAGEKANFAADGLETLDAASQLLYVGSAILERSIVSYFLNTSFNYKGKYYLNLTGRRDGASPFGQDVKYGNFGSVGVAWNLDQEEFLSQTDFFNELKLRSSYGTNGNMPIDWYAWRGVYGVGQNYANQPGYGVTNIENRNLIWEKNKPFNVGLDFSILNYRLSGTFDYYTRTTTDLLFNVPVSYTNGNPFNVLRNLGSIRNSGIELSLTSQNIKPSDEKGFSWSTNFNITTQNNEIQKLTETSSEVISGFFINKEGQEMLTYYMRGWAGVDPQTGEGMWYTDETKSETTKNFAEAQPFEQGSSMPDFFGGFTNTFGYKGFSLSFQIYYNWGNKIYDNFGHFTQSDGSLGLSYYGGMDRVSYENRWQEPGDNALAPKIVLGGSQTSTGQHSSRFLYDGSYLRLRDITLGYAIPVGGFINSAQVYVRGNNLLTYIKDDILPYDPEGYVGGLNNGQVPVSKQVVVGVNLSF